MKEDKHLILFSSLIRHPFLFDVPGRLQETKNLQEDDLVCRYYE